MHPILAVARLARRHPTLGEHTLWQRLRGDALGVRFRRQHVVGRFIADFACLRPRLVVEIDGPHHARQHAQDLERERVLRAEGFKVIRFSADDANERTDWVVDRIREHLDALNLTASRRASVPAALVRSAATNRSEKPLPRNSGEAAS